MASSTDFYSPLGHRLPPHPYPYTNQYLLLASLSVHIGTKDRIFAPSSRRAPSKRPTELNPFHSTAKASLSAPDLDKTTRVSKGRHSFFDTNICMFLSLQP